jgi:hypothetical protein
MSRPAEPGRASALGPLILRHLLDHGAAQPVHSLDDGRATGQHGGQQQADEGLDFVQSRTGNAQQHQADQRGQNGDQVKQPVHAASVAPPRLVWQLVQDGLPDDDMSVLVWVAAGGVWLAGWHEDGQWLDAASGAVIEGVTHWGDPLGPDDEGREGGDAMASPML